MFPTTRPPGKLFSKYLIPSLLWAEMGGWGPAMSGLKAPGTAVPSIQAPRLVEAGAPRPGPPAPRRLDMWVRLGMWASVKVQL